VTLESAMRRFLSYLLAGILAVLVTDFIVLPMGFGLAVRARAVAERGATTQYVDRTHKGDRLRVPAASTVPKAPSAMVACDPPFSPLLASARGHAPGRCVADITRSLAG
jgi:hypothetical protein